MRLIIDDLIDIRIGRADIHTVAFTGAQILVDYWMTHNFTSHKQSTFIASENPKW
jgi:hypothetical protein